MDNKISHLIKLIAKLPGLGPKSAKRITLHLIKNRDNLMLDLSRMINDVYHKIESCELCGNIDCSSPCSICSNTKRDDSTICVVEELIDLWAFERVNVYSGLYHVLNGTLSAVDCITPDMLNIHTLLDRVKNSQIKEVIIATNPTLSGQTTAQYIVEIMKPTAVKISFLAHGIPIGSEIDYLDEGTINIALTNRRSI